MSITRINSELGRRSAHMGAPLRRHKLALCKTPVSPATVTATRPVMVRKLG